MKAANEQLEWPDGATHYIGGGFHKYEDTSSSGECWVNNEWVTHLPSIDYYNGTSWTVHHNPTTTPYQPEVGEWCEYLDCNDNWNKCFYVGVDDTGKNVFSTKGDIWSDGDKSGFRPIKTEREQFIEHSLAITATEAITLEEAFTRQYDDGARFK